MGSALADGLLGSLRAVGWAAGFYLIHAWPIAVLAGIPASVRVIAALRGPSSAVTPLSNWIERFSSLLRVALLVVVAALDLAPDTSWWEGLWPGVWTSALGARLALMSGRIDAWIWMGLWAMVVVLVLTGLLKLLAWPRALAAAFRGLRVRPIQAARRADAVAVGLSGLVTLPLTSLIMYAAVARAGSCLHP